MAGDWIKVRTSLPADGRLRIVAKKCHATSVTALGALVTLWSLADAQADETGTLLGYDAAAIDEKVGLPGFCEALPSDWIDLSGEWVKLPEYQEHNGSTAKARAQTTKRKRKERTVTNVADASRSERDTSVTREEKRREEKEQEQAPADADVFLRASKAPVEGPTVDSLLANVSPQVAADFKKLRTTKKAPLTLTALEGIQREAAKASMTLERALATCCERGWQSFKADWLQGQKPAATGPTPPKRKELA